MNAPGLRSAEQIAPPSVTKGSGGDFSRSGTDSLAEFEDTKDTQSAYACLTFA